MGDLNCVLERIAALRNKIVADGIAHGVPFHLNDHRTLVERLKSEGSSFVKVTLPLLGKALDNALVTGQFNCTAAFKCARGTKLPIFLNGLFKEIFKDDGSLRDQPKTRSIFFLRQYLMFEKKLISEPTPVQKVQAKTEFIARQSSLSKVKIDTTNPVLLRAKWLLTRTLRHCDLSSITPGHGPGGVAENRDRIERWDIDSWPVRAERWYPYHEYGSQSFRSLCHLGAPVMVKESITKCSMVPKDFKGPRLISSESTATQYLQQGQMKVLMQYIEKHPLLSRSIRLRDQTHNQTLCARAYTSGLATLDLSNASDTVSAALVWFLLSGVPRLRSQLFCTRSQFVKIDNDLVRLVAFSPMGAAVCFPIETLVFWSLTMASVKLVHFHWAKSLGSDAKEQTLDESEIASSIAVFGDDIIVPDYALDILIGTLVSVGCSPNMSKTCYQTPFRESCGLEVYNRSDVTFTYNKRYNYDAAPNISNYPVLLDLQRKFFLSGLEHTSALLHQWAREISPTVTKSVVGYGNGAYDFRSEWLGTRWYLRFSSQHILKNRATDAVQGDLPLDDHDSFAIPSGVGRLVRCSIPFDQYNVALGWYTSRDSGVPTRYNKNYQRFECRLPCLFQRTMQWDTYRLPSPGRELSHTGSLDRRLRQFRVHSGYPRLLARVVGDTVERIAIRGFLLKMAWSSIPGVSAFTDPSD